MRRREIPSPLSNLLLLSSLLFLACSKSGDQDSGDTEDPPDTQETAEPGEEWRVDILSPTAGHLVDECGEVCVRAQLLHWGEPAQGIQGQIEIENFGVFKEGETDEEGLLRGCTSGFALGEHNLAVSFFPGEERLDDFTQFETAPFGLSFGMQKERTPLESPPAVPEFTRDSANPVLESGGEEEWDAVGILLPTVVTDGSQWTMYFSGTADVDYQIGGAVGSDATTWTKMETNPVLGASFDGGWRSYATNSPAALYDEGLYKVWFNGRGEENGGLSIGLATSEDGELFTDVENNPLVAPVEEWESQAVAHPTVIKNGDLYEMWYASSTLQLGYAISEDGLSWTKYCNNPVMGAEDRSTWEGGDVKSPEVLFDGTHYLMAYSAGGQGSWSIGWAMSQDGIRWVKHSSPILAPTDSEAQPFENRSVIGSPMVLQDDTLHLWYSGTSVMGSGVGYATAPWVSE